MRFPIVLSIFCLTLGSPAAANTSSTQARACFDEALAAAKNGARPAELITKYLDYRSIAANAAQYSSHRSWANTPEAVRKKMVQTVYDWFADESYYDDLELDTVKALRGGKANGSSFELPARYGPPEDRVFFSLLIHFDGRCRVIDVSESGAWLSFAIGQKF
jgi:hypothetical protein